MDKNFIGPRLSYEILNIPLSALATNLGLTLSMLEKIAKDNGWSQWFPDPDAQIYLDPDSNIGEFDGEDIFTVAADQYLDRNRKRLQVYAMAKNLATAELYADLEINLIDKARTAVMDIDVEDIKSLKDLSNVFKDLSKDLQNAGNAVSFATDQAGLPTVIIRDLSGS